MNWLCGLLLLPFHVSAEAAEAEWGPGPPAAKEFSVENVEENAVNSMEKLLFKVGNVYGGVAGGHQFTTIWTRDFCHASVGILQQESWKIGDEDVPSTTIVLTTLKALLNVTGSLGSPDKSKIPRALDWFPVHSENALTTKVLQGGAFLKSQTVLPMYHDVGKDLSKFPQHTPLQGFYDGEDKVVETTDAGYLIVRAFAILMPFLTPEELEEFLTGWGDKLRMVISFYSDAHRWGSRDHRWFFTQSAYTEWKDSCRQEGASSYSNLQLIESLRLLFEQAKTSQILRQTLVGAQLYGPRFGIEAPHLIITDSLTQYTDPVNGFEAHLTNWTNDVYEYFFDEEAGLLRELSTKTLNEELFQIAHIDAQLQWLQTCADQPELLAKISIDKIVEGFLTLGEDGSVHNIVGINAPKWPNYEVSSAKQAIGLLQYHGTFAWSWWACWFSELATLQGETELAEAILRWVWYAQNHPAHFRSKKFHEYFSEIYSGPKIAETLVYVSETPFLWGSSYCIRAANALEAAQSFLAEEELPATNESLMEKEISRHQNEEQRPHRRLRHGKVLQDDVSALLQTPLPQDDEL